MISKKHQGKSKLDVGLLLQYISLHFLKKTFNLTSSKINRRVRFKNDNIGVSRVGLSLDMYDIFLNYFKDCKFINAKRLSNIFSKLNTLEASKLFSFVSGYAKKTMSLQYEVSEWIKVVDLGSLYGYQKRKNRIGKSTVNEWLCHESELDIAGKKEIISNFDKLFSIALDILGPSNNTEYAYTFEEFLFSRHNWINDGSNKHSTLEIDGNVVKTKLGVALSNNNKQLLKLCSLSSIKKEGISAIIKEDERTLKLRYITNMSFGVYVKQKYLFEKLMVRLFNINPVLYAYTKKNGGIDGVMRDMQNDDLVPLDLEAFDTNINCAWFILVKKILLYYLYDEKKIIEQLFSLILDNKQRIKVYEFKNNKKVFVGFWKKGIPSGMFMTSFFGSLINAISQYYVCDQIGINLQPRLAFGDDALLRKGKSYNINLDIISYYYKKLGMRINVEKNWYTEGICEILKMVVTKTNVYQYPARAYSGLVYAWPDWRNNNAVEKLTSTASIIKDYYDRLGVFDNITIVDMLYNATYKKFKIRSNAFKNSWSKKLIYIWLHTPGVFGGFGLLPLFLGYKFKHKFRNLKLETKFSLYKYPVIKNMYVETKVTNIDILANINTLPNKQMSIFQFFDKRNIDWDDYLYYYNNIILKQPNENIRNMKGYVIKERNNKENLPFRKFGWSDIYVATKYKLLFIGFTRSYLRILQSLVLSANKYPLGSMLFK